MKAQGFPSRANRNWGSKLFRGPRRLNGRDVLRFQFDLPERVPHLSANVLVRVVEVENDVSTESVFCYDTRTHHIHRYLAKDLVVAAGAPTVMASKNEDSKKRKADGIKEETPKRPKTTDSSQKGMETEEASNGVGIDANETKKAEASQEESNSADGNDRNATGEGIDANETKKVEASQEESNSTDGNDGNTKHAAVGDDDDGAGAGTKEHKVSSEHEEHSNDKDKVMDEEDESWKPEYSFSASEEDESCKSAHEEESTPGTCRRRVSLPRVEKIQAEERNKAIMIEERSVKSDASIMPTGLSSATNENDGANVPTEEHKDSNEREKDSNDKHEATPTEGEHKDSNEREESGSLAQNTEDEEDWDY